MTPIINNTSDWVLMPREPLPEMLAAWYRYKNGHRFHDEEPARDTSDYGAYAAMLAAAPRPSADADAAGVVVKPLEWVDHTKGPGCPIRRIAHPFPGHVIWIFQAGEADHWYLSYNTGLNGKFLVKGAESEARAAAQADYERRIRSALVASQPPAGEPVAYQQLKDGKWVECSAFVAKGWGTELAEGCRPLYAQPPAPVVTDDGYERGLRRAAEIAMEENTRRIALASIRIPAMAIEIRNAILAEATALSASARGVAE